MTAQCESSDLYRGSSMDENCIFEPVTTSSFADESASNSASDSANTSSANIAQAVNKPKLGTYLIDRTIGKGIFSVVKLATHTITGINLAIKIIDKTRLDAENLVKIYRESEILKKLHHPNIVKLFQVMETPRLLYIAMEFLPNGEVFDYIANHGRFSEPVARVKFMDVLHAVDHIHSLGIVHRDIKAENLLFDAQMNIKLTDFSFGTYYYFASSSQPLLTTWCGSPPYAAPEIFKGEPYVGTKADIWSLGVVLYVMVCGTLPFDAQPLPHLKNQVLSASFRVPYWLSLTCERLIRCMLSKSPAKRPTTKEIMQHPWFFVTSVASTTGTVSSAICGTTPAITTTASCSDSVGLSEIACTPALSVDRPSPNADPSPRFERPFASTVGAGGGDTSCGSGTQPGFGSSIAQPERTRWYPTSLDTPGQVISNSAPEGEIGNLDEVVLLIMESLGMRRSQILESLDRRAYDHLMATYLLLGEKLRRHRQSLPFGPLHLIKSGQRTRSECDDPGVTSRAVDVEQQPHWTHAKHSRVDSAVDMKGSMSEMELQEGAALLSVSVPDSNHQNHHHDDNANREDQSCATAKWCAAREHRFSTPWTGTITTTATTAAAITNVSPTLTVTDTMNTASFQQEPRHQSCTDEPVFRVPHHQDHGRTFYPVYSTSQTTSIPGSALSPACPHHDQLIEPSHMPHPGAGVGYQLPSSIPHPRLCHAVTRVPGTVAAAAGDQLGQPLHVFPCSYSPTTESSEICENQSNFPWFIHPDSASQAPASPKVQRRTLVRRKYGVFNPPAYLDQLAQAVLSQQSSSGADAVTDVPRAIQQDPC